MTAKATGGHAAAKYTVTNHYLYFEKGMLSTNAQQVPIAALHDIDVRQSMTQKARGVGDVVVRFERGATSESVTLESINDFRNVQRILNEASHAARLALTKIANTHHYGDGSAPIVRVAEPAPTVAQPAQGANVAPDPMEQLRKLAELHAAGVLSDEEFSAKKAEILSRL